MWCINEIYWRPNFVLTRSRCVYIEYKRPYDIRSYTEFVQNAYVGKYFSVYLKF